MKTTNLISIRYASGYTCLAVRKTIALCLLCGLLILPDRGVKAADRDPVYRLETQLSYPETLRQTKGGVVMIEFRIDEESRIRDVKVHSDNKALRHNLTRQLLGIRLTEGNQPANALHTVRLRFRQ